MSTVAPKPLMFPKLAGVARALGHEHRLELIEHLGQGERSVEALAALAGLEVANASQHLQALRRAGLVTATRHGKYVRYRLADPAVVQVVEGLRGLVERQAAEVGGVIHGYLRDRDSLEPVSQDELVSRMRDGLVTLLDVRPADEFEVGHLPGAVSVPLADLRKRLRALSHGQEIVAYCRGPYCVLSFKAVAELRARGYRVRRLETGFPQWRAAGLPVETGPVARPRSRRGLTTLGSAEPVELP
jgi:ArsR family transcriptional regulator